MIFVIYLTFNILELWKEEQNVKINTEYKIYCIVKEDI